MDGVLIIDKPEGITSHDVVSRVRRILKTKRVGHTGTLDPFATGVLVLLVGKATRLAQFLDKDEKEYEAAVKLGRETDTGDRTGRTREITSDCLLAGAAVDAPSAGDIEKVLRKFRGVIDQKPPMYSAKKIAGKKLYELARQGLEIDRKPVSVLISDLELVQSEPRGKPDGRPQPADTLNLRVVCSAGTYIRTLAEDIGRELKTGASVEELRRTRAGRFDISQAFTLDTLKQMVCPQDVLRPIKAAVEHLPEMRLTADRVEKTRSGLASRFPGAELPESCPVQMLGTDGELVAIGVYDPTENAVRPKVVLI